MKSIWAEDYELMNELRNYAITYCTFVESGGQVGDFADVLLNKTIAVATKIKVNRDYIAECLLKDIPTEEEECKTAVSILEGTFKEDRLHSVIARLY